MRRTPGRSLGPSRGPSLGPSSGGALDWIVPPLLLLAGAATGLATVVVHQRWWGLPAGLAAGVAATALAPPGWRSRAALVLGWVLVVGLAVSPRAEGDYLVPGNLRGSGLLVGTLVLVVAALVTLPHPRRGGEAVHAVADDPGDRRIPT